MEKNSLDDPLTYVKAAILVAVILIVGITAIKLISSSNSISIGTLDTTNAISVTPTSSNTGGLLDSDSATGYQEINMTVDNGFVPNSFVVKAGVPVRWNVYVKQYGGCLSGLYSQALNIDYQFQQTGITKTFEFTPTQAETISFSCLMGMIQGQIKVQDSGTVADVAAANAAAANAPVQSTGGCGCGR